MLLSELEENSAPAWVLQIGFNSTFTAAEQRWLNSKKTLDDPFHNTLKDVYFAERKIVATLQIMAKVATSPLLKKAFLKHQVETEGLVKRRERVFGLIGVNPKAKLRCYHAHCEGRLSRCRAAGTTCWMERG